MLFLRMPTHHGAVALHMTLHQHHFWRARAATYDPIQGASTAGQPTTDEDHAVLGYTGELRAVLPASRLTKKYL